jgi:gliding motility-associated-like protein
MVFKNIFSPLIFLIIILLPNKIWSQSPTLISTGDQFYCPLEQVKIVEYFNITNPSATEIKSVYIQISTGYVKGSDKLKLTGNHPNITAQTFNSLEGKLILDWTGTGTAIITELSAAVIDVVFENTSATPSGSRTFSITIGEANYLPSTGHYYEYIEATGITWTEAKTAAEALNYYDLKGYLATITSTEEAKLSGEQAAGAGWIGGSDSQTEGVWKWVTGPESGTIFWNGLANGSSPSGVYSNWNTGEPNQAGNEDYAHVTAPGVGNPGSWNDLSNTGASSGDFQPKGFIVEYGGTPGDPILKISTSTTISIAEITSTTPSSKCGEGILTISAEASLGTVLWFDTATGGTPIYNGNSFTTPTISTPTIYYAVASADGICETGERKPVIATIYAIPTITSVKNSTKCEGGSGTLSAIATSGNINWHNDDQGGSPIATGTSFTTPNLSSTTSYYVDATENGCTSPVRTEVILKILNNDYSFNVSTISLDAIKIKDDSNNNTITINDNSAIDNSEFDLDSFDEFQENPDFENVAAGIHTIYFRNKENCSISYLKISIIGYPKFFTPNGDGENDTWQVKGVNETFYPASLIYIYDRFGKLIAKIDPTGEGWDGFFNGKILPATDYWFSVQLIDGTGNIREKRGHFSLISR